MMLSVVARFIIIATVFHHQFVESASTYGSKALTDATLKSDAVVTLARSPTECVLRCKRSGKQAFYGRDEECLCSDGVGNDDEDNTGDVKSYSGNLYIQVRKFPE